MPIPLLNRVLGLAPAAALGADTFDGIVETYRQAGVDQFGLTVWDGLAENPLKDGWDDLGWEPDRRQTFAKFLFELDRPLPAVSQDRPFQVRSARPHEQTIAGGIICHNFGLPDAAVPWMGALADRPRWQMFFACDASGAPIATGALFIAGIHAWLGMGTTLPAMREQSAQQMLLAVRLAAAKAAGCVSAVVEAAPPGNGEIQHSFNNMGRSGFRQIARRLTFVRRIA